MGLKNLLPFRRKRQPSGSKASRATLSSAESDAAWLPEHVVNEKFERDDISSIHYGESVGSPLYNPNFPSPQQQSAAELDIFVPNIAPKALLDGLHGGAPYAPEAIMRDMSSMDESSAMGNKFGMLDSILGEMEVENNSQDLDEDSVTAEESISVGEKSDQPMFDDGCETMVVCLSLLKTEGGNDVDSISNRIVRESLKNHLEFCHRNCTTDDDKSVLIDTDDIIEGEPEKFEELSRQFIARSEYQNAIEALKVLAGKQRDLRMAETADTFSKISTLCLYLGKFNESLHFGKKALKLNKEKGRQVEATICMMNLGMIFLGGKKPDRALAAWREAFQMGCRSMGYDHPCIAVLLNNMACLHYLERDFVTTFKTFLESMNLQQQCLGTSSSAADLKLINIACTTGNIAAVSAQQGDYETAVGLLEEALSIQESVLPETNELLETTIFYKKLFYEKRDEIHPKPSRTSTSLFGNSNTAFDFPSEQALVHSNGTYPVDKAHETHPSIFGDSDGVPMKRASTKSCLYVDETDLRDVILLGPLENELTPRERVREAVLSGFGMPVHCDAGGKMPFVPYSGTPRRRMRIPIDVDQDNVMDAELHLGDIYKQALEHLEHNEIDEALELFESVLGSHRDKYGDIHHLVGTANHNIGLVHMFAEKYTMAMRCFQEAVTVRSAALGFEHPDVASSLLKIGMIQLVHRNAEDARDTFISILDLLHQVLGYEHIQVAKAWNNLAVAQYQLGSYLDAFRSFERAHEVQRRLLLILNSGEKSRVTLHHIKIVELALANTLNNMGYLYYRQKKYFDSLRMLYEASKLRRKHLEATHPAVVRSNDNLRALEFLAGVSVKDHYVTLEGKDREKGSNGPEEFIGKFVDLTLSGIKEKLECARNLPYFKFSSA